MSSTGWKGLRWEAPSSWKKNKQSLNKASQAKQRRGGEEKKRRREEEAPTHEVGSGVLAEELGNPGADDVALLELGEDMDGNVNHVHKGGVPGGSEGLVKHRNRQDLVVHQGLPEPEKKGGEERANRGET